MSAPAWELRKFNLCHDSKGRFCPGGADVAHASPYTVKLSTRRAFTGAPVSVKTKLSKLETDRLAEGVLTAYLQQTGLKDARTLNVKGNNFPVDLVADHRVIELKAGLVSNRADAQKWRATIGAPGKRETELMRKLSPAQLRAHNDAKRAMILERKQRAVAELSEIARRPLKAHTYTMIINPDTRRADIFRFDGFHLNIRWNSEQARRSYVGTVAYSPAGAS